MLSRYDPELTCPRSNRGNSLGGWILYLLLMSIKLDRVKVALTSVLLPAWILSTIVRFMKGELFV
jgi:hypothetical protein